MELEHSSSCKSPEPYRLRCHWVATKWITVMKENYRLQQVHHHHGNLGLELAWEHMCCGDAYDMNTQYGVYRMVRYPG